MVANANVMILFYIHFHMVIMSDVENERNLMNSRKTSVLQNGFQSI